MAKYTFHGRVLPERAGLSFTRSYHMKLTPSEFADPARAWYLDLDVSVLHSAVSVLVQVDDAIEVHIPTLYANVEHAVRMLIDAFGHWVGAGYDVELISCVGPDGRQEVFGVGVELGRGDTRSNLAFEDVLDVAGVTPEIARAFASAREAVRSISDSAFHCFRAIECLRQYYEKPSDAGRDLSWQRLRTSLRVSRSYIGQMESYATHQRHGGATIMSGNQREWMLHATWELLDRFTSMRLADIRGGTPPHWDQLEPPQ